MRYIVIPILIVIYLYWTATSIISLKKKEDSEAAGLWALLHVALFIVGFVIACVRFW